MVDFFFNDMSTSDVMPTALHLFGMWACPLRWVHERRDSILISDTFIPTIENIHTKLDSPRFIQNETLTDIISIM